MGQHLPGFGSVGAGIQHRLHRLAYLAGADRLQCTRDLGDILYAPNAEPDFAGIGHNGLLPGAIERVQSGSQLGRGLVADTFLLGNIFADLGIGSIHETQKRSLPEAHLVQ